MSWRLHAPVVSRINLVAFDQLARTTPFYLEFRLARQMLEDAEMHVAGSVAHQFARQSTLTKNHAETMVTRGLLEPTTAEMVANWGIANVVGEVTKERLRTVLDMLPGNARLPDAPPVHLQDMVQWVTTLLSFKLGVSLDMTGWYFQIPVSDDVAAHMCILVDGQWYRLKHAPMGHKWSVFIGHTLTSILAFEPGVSSSTTSSSEHTPSKPQRHTSNGSATAAPQ